MSYPSRRLEEESRQRLAEYFFAVGGLSVLLYGIIFRMLNQRLLSEVEFTYLVLAWGTLAWIRVTGRNVLALVRVHMVCVFAVAFAITWLMGGIVAAGGFTLWGIITPLAAMVFLGRGATVVATAVFVLGIVAVAALGPTTVHRTPMEPHLFAWYVALNVIGVTAFVVLTVGWVLRRLGIEQRQGAAAQAEALKAQKLESLGTLAGGIAHDFNNLLTGFLGNLDLAMEQLEAGEPGRARELLERSRDSVERARALTGQLLAFARGGTPVKATASVGETVKESAAFVLRGTAASCRTDLAPDLWPVHADLGQISQLVQNLVLNAAQAMPGGGTIDLRCSNVAAGSRMPGLDPRKRFIRLEVADHGVGIAEPDRNRVFDPYFTTRTGGTGLGLTMAYAIVRSHGGLITFDTEVGRGTTFLVYLPASDDPLPAPVVAKSPAGGRVGRILVMDDEAVVLDVAARLLRQAGHEVVTAREGATAAELYRKAMAEGRRFDAAIFDLTIKGGMGGVDAVRAVLEADPAARVLACSGYANNGVMADHRAHGFCGVLRKPYGADELRRAVGEVLDAGICASGNAAPPPRP